jgi:hypothetical protein
MRARWLALVLGLALAGSGVARAQDVDTGVVDSGVDSGEVDAGVDAGETDAGEPEPDAGPPSDEQPDFTDTELPDGHQPAVELTLSPESDVMTGDLVTATIAVTLTEGDDVAVPQQTFGQLELHDQRHTDRPIDGGRRVFVFELDFLMLEPGDHELPPIRLRVVTEGGVVGTVHTPARTIHVGSLLANEPDAQPRAATPPVVVMQDDYTLLYVLGVLGIIAATALITWLVARWWRRQPKPVPPPPPPRPAWEVALEKLEGAKKRLPAALSEGKQVEVVDGVSDALREYLGARYDFNGLESTTDEVISRVKHQRLGGIAIEEIVALLGDADLVKFAKAVPDDETCKRMIEGAVRIVRGTMSVSAPAITPPAAPAGERRSTPGEGRKKRSSMPSADERMVRAAQKSQAVADQALAEASGEGAVRDDGRREIPNTNPPEPPKTSAPAAAESAPAAENDVGRVTPVGHADPSGASPSPQPSPGGAGEGVPASSTTASSTVPSGPWRESKATVFDGTRDETAPKTPDGEEPPR